MKRSLSDSDDESLFDEHDALKSSSPSQSCQITDRKKRRGIIEKRRRDRINNSLSELRRLVPSAFEKQGSAKLEKAEILQMTVDHLKMLHQKGQNQYNFPDPHHVAMDYRGVGYRECASEVARYLVAVEGMDLQDPMRLRLLSHLQCYSAQREAAAKVTLQNSSWNAITTHNPFNNQYSGGNPMSGMGSMIASQPPNHQPELNMSSHSTHQGLSSVTFSEARISQPEISSTSLHSNVRLPSTMNVPLHGQMPNMNNANGQQVSPPLIPQLHSQFPVSLNMNSMQSMMAQNNTTNSYNNSSPSVKPYRPWGSELAY